jgi:ferredoxin
VRPVVDEELCIGCGGCEDICPGIFNLVDDISMVVDPEGCDIQDCCEAAEENCPVGAISLVED